MHSNQLTRLFDVLGPNYWLIYHVKCFWNFNFLTGKLFDLCVCGYWTIKGRRRVVDGEKEGVEARGRMRKRKGLFSLAKLKNCNRNYNYDEKRYSQKQNLEKNHKK